MVEQIHNKVQDHFLQQMHNLLLINNDILFILIKIRNNIYIYTLNII